MTYAYTEKKRFRRSFSKNSHKAKIPSLLRLQQDSYRKFLQKDVPPDEREDFGLQHAFKSVFPIFSSSGVISLEFDKYELIGHSNDDRLWVVYRQRHRARCRVAATPLPRRLF